MLKTFELCPKKFNFRYVKNINMPVNDDIFELGKNIHALASYYLRKENIDKMELALSEKEAEIWQYLKSSVYFTYTVINTEYSLSVKIGEQIFGGRLDALVRDEEKYYILDYKTGSAPKGAKYDFQTMIYMLAVKEYFKTDKVNFVYLDLRNKDEVKIELTPELEQEYRKKLIETANRVNNINLNKKNADCSCEYSIICY